MNHLKTVTRASLTVCGACMLLVTPWISPRVHAETESTAPPVVVSGFEPFGGRNVNASWLLAQAIGKAHPKWVRTRQVPVVWGAPLKTIEETKPMPKVWIAFGEGTRTFQIEVLARVKRGAYPDNRKEIPTQEEIVQGGAAQLENRVAAQALAEALTKRGFPTKVSRNAGAYLCEEMLYSLLHSQKEHPEALGLVLFIHVPILGQQVSLPPVAADREPESRTVDGTWLSLFGEALIRELTAKDLLPGAPPTPAEGRAPALPMPK